MAVNRTRSGPVSSALDRTSRDRLRLRRAAECQNPRPLGAPFPPPTSGQTSGMPAPIARSTGEPCATWEGEPRLRLYSGRTDTRGASQFEVAPGIFHELRVYARGGDFSVYLDRDRKWACSDPQPLPAGEIGIWSGEGPCRFEKFFARPLASD